MQTAASLTPDIARQIVQEIFGATGINQDISESVRPLATEQYQFSDVFLRELIQNACDAGSKRIRIEVAVSEAKSNMVVPTQLVFKNDGQAFSRDDLRALLVPHKTTKRERTDTIGNKGVGFFSLLKVASRITIRSAGVRFQMHRQDYRVPPQEVVPDPQTEGQAGAWFEMELIAEYAKANLLERLLPENLALSLHEHLYFSPLESLEIVKKKGTKDETVALFQRVYIPLPNPTLSQQVFSGSVNEIRVEEGRSGRTHMLRVFTRTFRNTLPGPALGKKDRYQVRLGFQLERNQIVRYQDAPFFVWLPSELATGLGFAIDAPFIVNQDRNTIAEDLSVRAWNEMILHNVVALLGEVIPLLATQCQTSIQNGTDTEVLARYNHFLEVFCMETAGTERVGLIPRTLEQQLYSVLQKQPIVLLHKKRACARVSGTFDASETVGDLDIIPCADTRIAPDGIHLLEKLGIRPVRAEDIIAAIENLAKQDTRDLQDLITSKGPGWLARIYGYLAMISWTSTDINALQKKGLVLGSDYVFWKPGQIYWCASALRPLATRYLPVVHADVAEGNTGAKTFLRQILRTPEVPPRRVLEECIQKGLRLQAISEPIFQELAIALDYITERGDDSLVRSLGKVECLISEGMAWKAPYDLLRQKQVPDGILADKSAFLHARLEELIKSNCLDNLQFMSPEEIATTIIAQLIARPTKRDPEGIAQLRIVLDYLANQSLTPKQEKLLGTVQIFPDSQAGVSYPAELYLPDCKDSALLFGKVKFLGLGPVSSSLRHFLVDRLGVRDRPTIRIMLEILHDACNADDLNQSHLALDALARRAMAIEEKKFLKIASRLRKEMHLKTTAGDWNLPGGLVFDSEITRLVAEPGEILHPVYVTTRGPGNKRLPTDIVKPPALSFLENLGVQESFPPERLIAALDRTVDIDKTLQILRQLANMDLSTEQLRALKVLKCIPLKSKTLVVPGQAILETETTRLMHGARADFAILQAGRLGALYEELGVIKEFPLKDIIGKFLETIQSGQGEKSVLSSFYTYLFTSFPKLTRDQRTALQNARCVLGRSGTLYPLEECYKATPETDALYHGFLQPISDLEETAQGFLALLGIKTGTSLEEVQSFISYLCRSPEDTPIPVKNAERVHVAFTLLKNRYPDMLLVLNTIQGKRVLLDSKNIPRLPNELFWDDQSEIADAFRGQVPMAAGAGQKYLLQLGVLSCTDASSKTLIDRQVLNPQPSVAALIQRRVAGIEKTVEFVPDAKESLQPQWRALVRGIQVKITSQLIARVSLGRRWKDIRLRVCQERNVLYLDATYFNGKKFPADARVAIARQIASLIALGGLENNAILLILASLSIDQTDTVFRAPKEKLEVTKEGTRALNATNPVIQLKGVDLRTYSEGFPAGLKVPSGSGTAKTSSPKIPASLRETASEEGTIRFPPEARLEDDLIVYPEIHLTRQNVDGIAFYAAKGESTPPERDLKAIRQILDNIARSMDVNPANVKITTMRNPEGLHRKRTLTPASELFISAWLYNQKNLSTSYFLFILTVAHEAAHAQFEKHDHQHAALAQDFAMKSFHALFSLKEIPK